MTATTPLRKATGSTAPRPHWTAQELALLRELYPHQHTAMVAAAVGRAESACYRMASYLGLRKTRECMARVARERITAPGHGSHAMRFKPGHTTWNKGRAGTTGRHPNTVAHHFTAGTVNGRAAQLVMPVGALRVNSDGTLERKISTLPGASTKRWQSVHRLLWEAEHGPIPAGHVVAFKAGHKTTDVAQITLDKVDVITRAENMRRNSYHTHLPPDLARLVQLRGALSRQINRKTNEAAQQAGEAP